MVTPDGTPPPLRDEDLEPVGRDASFLVRLVMAIIVAVSAAAFVGYRLKRAAGGCGANLIRPGESVIPPPGR